MKFIKYFETAQERQSCTDTYKYLSYTEEDKIVNMHPYDYSQDYLTLIALSNGTFEFTGKLTTNTISYSIDNGETWTTPANNVTVNVNTGDKVLWKGEMTPSFSPSPPSIWGGIGSFKNGTALFEAQGNPMSLLYGDNYINKTSLENQKSAFASLFVYSKIVNAKYLYLNFVLYSHCYASMFFGCTFLTQIPELPATTLAYGCYMSMFQECTSLTQTPELPATTLADNCYSEMFRNCTSLITAPKLPATSLTNMCYGSMFSGCTSLITAPELPATILSDNCYQFMFVGCTNLNYIKMLATDISANQCLISWLTNVAANGTFVKAASMTSLPTGTSGIPEGWIVQDDI